jgi:hypothetical protein
VALLRFTGVDMAPPKAAVAEVECSDAGATSEHLTDINLSGNGDGVEADSLEGAELLGVVVEVRCRRGGVRGARGAGTTAACGG